MGNTFGEDREIQYNNSGSNNSMGNMGGLLAMIILIVVVLWLLFKDGNRGHNDCGVYPPYAMYPQAPKDCGICVKDESNWEEDRHISDKLDNQSEKTRGLIVEQEEKTRALIAHNNERAEDRYVAGLIAASAAKDTVIATMSTKEYINHALQGVYAMIGKTDADVVNGFCKETAIIEKGFCETPKRPQYYADGFYDMPCRGEVKTS